MTYRDAPCAVKVAPVIATRTCLSGAAMRNVSTPPPAARTPRNSTNAIGADAWASGTPRSAQHADQGVATRLAGRTPGADDAGQDTTDVPEFGRRLTTFTTLKSFRFSAFWQIFLVAAKLAAGRMAFGGVGVHSVHDDT